MTRRLLATYLLLTLVVLLALEVPLALGYRDHEIDALRSDVQRDAFVLASYVADDLAGTSAIDLDTVVENYTDRTGGRAVIVDSAGDVLADSEPAVAGQRNFASRPEIATALQGEVAEGTRYSSTLGTGLLYVAVPVSLGGRTLGAVRVSYETGQVDARIHRYWALLVAAGVVTMAIATGLGIVFARWVTGPIAGLQRAATRIGEGELSTRADEHAGPPEVRDLASAFNATAARLEDLVTAQENFVADASHQLRTPLTALRLRLEMLEADADESIADDLEGARREVQRMSRLVDGLLVLARAERSRAALPEPTALAPILDERLVAWGPLAAERDVSLLVDDTDLRARCTPDHLESVLDNLLANAIEHSSPGGTVTLRAEVEPQAAGSMVGVHVIDEGPGLDPDQRERAFDRFWRASARRPDPDGDALGGSGLGLAIVRRLVEIDRGTAELRAAPGGGVDATVLFHR